MPLQSRAMPSSVQLLELADNLQAPPSNSIPMDASGLPDLAAVLEMLKVKDAQAEDKQQNKLQFLSQRLKKAQAPTTSPLSLEWPSSFDATDPGPDPNLASGVDSTSTLATGA